MQPQDAVACCGLYGRHGRQQTRWLQLSTWLRTHCRPRCTYTSFIGSPACIGKQLLACPGGCKCPPRCGRAARNTAQACRHSRSASACSSPQSCKTGGDESSHQWVGGKRVLQLRWHGTSATPRQARLPTPRTACGTATRSTPKHYPPLPGLPVDGDMDSAGTNRAVNRPVSTCFLWVESCEALEGNGQKEDPGGLQHPSRKQRPLARPPAPTHMPNVPLPSCSASSYLCPKPEAKPKEAMGSADEE